MTKLSEQTPREDVDLTIPLATVCFIIVKAREFDVKDVATDTDDGSNAADDGVRAVLEDRKDDTSQRELRGIISALTEDEQIELVALTWLGRDEYPGTWEEVRAQAADAHNDRTASYLIGNPLLADHLSDGLSMLGLSCADIEAQHL